jgi:branched-chain amino acid transport system substrate-binding protein
VSDAAPILVGILEDRPGSGESATVTVMRRVLDEAVASGRIDRPVTLVTENTNGLPEGTAAEVTAGFHRLVDQNVLLIMGPTITDNGLIVRDLADAARVPCCNWSGSDASRSEWMFHYQVGSLEEEPHLLADHMSSLGHQRVALVQDRSPIGNRYGSFFEDATARVGMTITSKSLISPVSTDLDSLVAGLCGTDVDALVYLGLGLSAAALGRGLTAAAWQPPVFLNSAGMFGYGYPEWVKHWEGWTYVDAWDEDNSRLQALLAGRAPGDATMPMALAAGDDMGRLAVEGLAGAESLTCLGVKESLERVKRLPASLGEPGTTMGFGIWDRAALKGGFILLRQWVEGRSVRVH